MILLTGATGFIGIHLVRLLIKEKMDFCCLVRNNSDTSLLDKLNVKIIKGNLKDQNFLNNAFKGMEQVIHLAGVTNGSIEKINNSNVNLTKKIINASTNNNVKKIIFISSIATIMGKSTYGLSKLKAEKLIEKSNINYLIFRCSVIYGQGDDKNISSLIKLIRYSKIIPILGDGKYLIQPIYVEDVVSIIVKAIQSHVRNKIYYLSSNSIISFNDAIDVLCKEMNVKRFKIHIPLSLIKFLAKFYIKIIKDSDLPIKQILDIDKQTAVDISKTEKDFGFSPIGFRNGIKKTIKPS